MRAPQNLIEDYKLHKKSRTEKHSSYPDRFVVPDNKLDWKTPFSEYKPKEFNAPVVLDNNTVWADPQDISKVKHTFSSFEGEVKFNNKCIPLNPFGRTGIEGRGVLGKWGANFAVDGLITTISPDSNSFQVLTIVRGDTGENAFPGGMVDLNESVFETRNRELDEELSVKAEDLSNPLYEQIVYEGYVDDPRNTDNAWMETTVIHAHLSYSSAKNMKLSAGDDAKAFKWITISEDNIANFYANHGYSLMMALDKLIKSDASFIDSKILNTMKKLLIQLGFNK